MDPFRTAVYSGEILVFCRILFAGMGINKETRLVLALILPSLPPWALAGIRALGTARGTELHGPCPTKDMQDTGAVTRATLLCSQALPAPLG